MSTTNSGTGFGIDTDQSEPRYWRCLLCTLAGADETAMHRHLYDTGHGFIADNAYADLLEAHAIEQDRLLRMISLLYEGERTTTYLRSLDAHALTEYLDSLRRFSLGKSEAPYDPSSGEAPR